ncbi:MAG TPA: LytR C-terminal domain-containing protein [Gemmatimonadales bacterium]|nr:LytR C-terminal domain-containing protein [Gemmatimonadales bacterium]
MELARRRVLAALIGVALVATTATALVLRSRPDRVAGHAYPIPSADDRILVEVLNGTGRSGLARSATRVLRRRGLDVVYFGTWEGEGLVRTTKVVARRSGSEDDARQVAAALGSGKVVVDLDTLRRVDVSVILGEDWTPPVQPGP